MTRRLPFALAVLTLILAADRAGAQPAPALRPAPPSRSFQIGGYGTYGSINFTAKDTLRAVLGTSSGPIVGGGATVGVPLGGLYVDIGAWRFKQDGQRVFIGPNNEIFPLGIPLNMTVTALEFTAGWKFRRRTGRLMPYVGAGMSSYGYKETSSFAGTGDDVDDRFNGYHVVGGIEYMVIRWIRLGGEVAWATVPDALGGAGISKTFGDTDLGGTSLRAKLTIGR